MNNAPQPAPHNPDLSHFAPGYHHITPSGSSTLSELVEIIRSPRLLDLTKRIRKAYASAPDPRTGKQAIADLKQGLPGVTLAGTFRQRKAADVILRSGLVQIDIDGLEPTRLEEARRLLQAQPWIAAVWTSPSGAGLKAAARVQDYGFIDSETYFMDWRAVTRALTALGLENDPAAKDLGRLALLAHDPDAYVNLYTTPLGGLWYEEPLSAPEAVALRSSTAVAEQPTIIRRARAYLATIPEAIDGKGGHAQTYTAAVAMVHGFGIDADTAFDLLKTDYNPRCQPPWTDAELRHKVDDAATKEHDRPYGWLRDAPSSTVRQAPTMTTEAASASEAAATTITTWTEPDPLTPDASWSGQILRAGKAWKPHSRNVEVCFHHDPRLKGTLRLNTLTQTVEVVNPPWRRAPGPLAWVNTDAVALSHWLAIAYVEQPAISDEIVQKASTVIASQHPYHPIRDYLQTLSWDGICRIDTWLTDVLHLPDIPYHSAIGRRFLISAVARVMDPGAKVDTMLIIEGDQGTGKSTCVRTLFGEAWYTDAAIDLDNKDTAQIIRGKWVVEFAELTGLRKAEVNILKHFLSRAIDRQRDAYARVPEDHPRQCVFIGTTNKDCYLQDETGGRRFWPVGRVIQQVDLDLLARIRDQLWAEAFHAFQSREGWWLTTEEEALATVEQETRLEVDEWIEPIETCLNNRYSPMRSDHFVTGMEIWTSALGGEKDAYDSGKQRRIAAIMSILGWYKKNTRRNGQRLRGYVPTEKKLQEYLEQIKGTTGAQKPPDPLPPGTARVIAPRPLSQQQIQVVDPSHFAKPVNEDVKEGCENDSDGTDKS